MGLKTVFGGVLRRRCGTGLDGRSGRIDLVLGAVAGVLYHNCLDMVKEAGPLGRGHGGIVIEVPLRVVVLGAVRSEDCAGLFAPRRENLREHVGTGLVDGQIAHLVEHLHEEQESRPRAGRRHLRGVIRGPEHAR